MDSLRILLRFALLAALVAAGACTPQNGPMGWDIRRGQIDPQSLQYAFVPVTPKVVDVLAHNLPRLATTFTDHRPPGTVRFGIGDAVSVTIFEAAAGGLFIPSEAGVRPGNFITLPNQEVDVNGNISVPYAGQIRANGRTQVEVQQEIVDALKNRAIEPQAVVSLVTQRTSLINVLGDVRSAGRLPAIPAGERILDVITRAGGTSGAGADEWVILERNGKRALAPFGALVYEPANNIWAHAGDTLYVYREPQTFLALGATGGTQAQVPFDAWRLTLAEAVAKAGGLNDAMSDAASIFLYRGETHEVAAELGIDAAKYPGLIIPVIYNLNVRDPAAYFLATKFEMRNKDVVFISNSASVEVTKVLNYLMTINSAINAPISTALNYVYLKNAIISPPTTVAVPITTPAVP